MATATKDKAKAKDAPAQPAEEPQADAQAPAADAPTPQAPDAPGKDSNLWQRLHWVMGRLGYLPKGGENPHFNYEYTTEADTVAAVRRLLVPARLVFLVNVLEGEDQRERPTRGGKTTTITKVRVECTVQNIDNPEDRYTTVMTGEGEDPADKGFWKAYSGVVKYFWLKHLLIATGQDDPEASGTEGVGEGQGQGQGKGQQQGQGPRPEQVMEWRTEVIGLGYTLLNGKLVKGGAKDKVEQAMRAARMAEETVHVGKALRYVRTVAEAVGAEMDPEAYSQAELELAEAR